MLFYLGGIPTEEKPMPETSRGPLSGVRVLELAGLAPGPFAGMMLADHGADVLRVDRVGAVRDAPRRDVMDRGKHTIGLDLKSPEGVAAFKELVANADVVIEVFRPGVAERLGIGPDDLHAVNERLVYGRMTGWGGRTGRSPRPPGTTSTTSRSPACCRCSAAPATSRPRRSTSSATSPAAASCWPTACCWPCTSASAPAGAG
ncbi:hypothetical protein GCM10020001_019640 [Nonomuraea salmonea]